MNDVVLVSMMSREVARETERQFIKNTDPDSLYKYEMWDTIGARSTLKERLTAFAARFTRRRMMVEHAPAIDSRPSTSTKCVPQS